MNLWVRSSTPNVDLQATISEVRPDGKETFVQSGWMRANERKLDAAKSTLLEPVLSLRAGGRLADARRPVRRGHDPALLRGPRVPRRARASACRISAPNGDQPIWSFGETDPAGQAKVAIGYGRTCPRASILPVVPGVSAPTGLPPCPGLRGEPCRDYQPFANAAGTLQASP